MKKIFLINCLLLHAFFIAQTLTLDTTFNSELFNGYGFSETSVFAVQEDGKVLLGKKRLNNDGSIDSSFQMDNTLNNLEINKITIQPDGKIIYNGTIRLNSDGSIDNSFNIPSINGIINSLIFQNDGKLIIGGSFSIINNQSHNRIARLNIDGTIDPTFNVNGTGAQFGVDNNTQINDIKIVENNKILVVGNFQAFNGTPQNHICKLNNDGTIDATFNSGLGFSHIYSSQFNINTISVQNDGKYIIGGCFTNYNNNNFNSIVRINNNGSIDTSFNSGNGVKKIYLTPLSGSIAEDTGTVYSTQVLPSGKILIAGDFLKYDTTRIRHFALLNSNGSLDQSFYKPISNGPVFYSYSISSIINDGVIKKMVLKNNNIYIGGHFKFYDNVEFTDFPISGLSFPDVGFAKLNIDGSVDSNFNKVKGPNNTVNQSFVLSDGKILISGAFSRYNGKIVNGLVRLNSDGTVDQSFSSGEGFSSRISSIKIQPDNKILVHLGSSTSYYNSTLVKSLVRLNPDGTLDTSFDPFIPIGNDIGYVNYFGVQSDGKIILNISSGNLVYRLNIDGSKDTTFSDTFTYNGAEIYVLNNNKFMLRQYDYQLKRYNENGDLDTSFVPFHVDSVNKIELLQDGKLLICGKFTIISNTFNFARINSNGTFDYSFTPIIYQTQYFDPVNTFEILNNGNILYSKKNKIYMINSNGVLINSFDDNIFTGGFPFGISSNLGYIYSINKLNDNKILVGGNFRKFNDIIHSPFIRLNLSLLSNELFDNNSQITLFPNPTSDFLNINTSYNNWSYKIVTLDGKEVSLLKIASKEDTQIDISHLQQGIYFVAVVVEGKVIKNLKFIKN